MTILIHLRPLNEDLFVLSHTAGEDYIGRTKALPLSFQTSALISPETRGKACGSVMLINDNITEGNETFRVTLQENPDDSSVVLGDQASAIVTIIDDDKRKAISVSSPNIICDYHALIVCYILQAPSLLHSSITHLELRAIRSLSISS